MSYFHLLVYIASCGVHKLIATWCRICGSYYYRVQYPYTKSRGYSIWNPLKITWEDKKHVFLRLVSWIH